MSELLDDKQFKSKNHFVPRSYLKQWVGTDGRLSVYRLLVSNANVPLWKRSSAMAVAYHHHLYTKVAAGAVSDEIERWLDAEFEAPAEPAIAKVINEERLAAEDWRRLVRFLAAQDVRTPARLMESLRRWNTELPKLLDEVLKEAAAKMEAAHREGRRLEVKEQPDSEFLGGRLITRIEPGAETGAMGYEMVAGRNLWLFMIRTLLMRTIRHLHQHRWTILRAPRDLEWPTSDDPVIRLNFVSETQYDFKGGWGSNGTELFMPLGPRHLMYTRIGHRPPVKWTEPPESQAHWLRRFIVEHGHRHILARTHDPEVERIRSRHVDATQYQREQEQWRQWHQEQTDAEVSLFTGRE